MIARPGSTSPLSIDLHWLGHATVLVEDRARILTDPLLTDTLLHLHRRAGPLSSHLPDRVDAVVVSHLHMDHLHLPSLALLAPNTLVLVPRGAGRLLRRTALRPVEVTAGDVVTIAGATVTVVPAVHAATRWPFGRVRGDAVGYVVRGEGTTYFAGDTSLFPGMRDIAGTDLDVALLPVGGWGPSLRGEHLTSRDAAEALPLVGAKVAIPIHYGTFWPRGLGGLRTHLFHEPGREFARHARAVAPEVDVRVLAPGSATTVRPPVRRERS